MAGTNSDTIGKAHPDLEQIIKIAIMAVGGQGGGVLTNWIESLARTEGYHCQATSVAGVAQRTGATIYYIEMAPASIPTPVFALAPSAGDVDVLIAAELAEAGRAITRGFVTPDRTTLIGSTHRSLAVSEKTVPGNGVAPSEEILAATEIAARTRIMADMEAAAVSVGSVISASLFGALAASGALPFPREAFEKAIKGSGKGVDSSLRAFAAGHDLALNGEIREPETPSAPAVSNAAGPEGAMRAWSTLSARIGDMPEPVRELALAGLRKVVDFQDTDYGLVYLNRLEEFLACDHASREFRLSRAAAKYIANALAYDDVIRVADLKTRADRFDRIRDEMRVADGYSMRITEYLHPGVDELIGMLPAKMGNRLDKSETWRKRIDRWFSKGRRIRSDRLFGFFTLYCLGGLRGWRRRTFRHSVEMAHMDRWLGTAREYLPDRYDMAVEVLNCRRLIKGYSDTHARGQTKFDRVLSAARLVDQRTDGPQWMARMREAALKDEDGKALEGAIRTIETFTEERQLETA
ncbi:indolepyruvate oxidoreductase subunit beta family protein [Roseibium sediminis]|uniref:indolepyruvate oxidoreductase subunit beta family protein n=1 Tax=Roseibium sediminis TaxID=1775174 RepID=UPI00123D998A|nr:indolepyruvate oxidoreductase subunit beta family protein [Roseibium sediminis]